MFLFIEKMSFNLNISRLKSENKYCFRWWCCVKKQTKTKIISQQTLHTYIFNKQSDQRAFSQPTKMWFRASQSQKANVNKSHKSNRSLGRHIHCCLYVHSPYQRTTRTEQGNYSLQFFTFDLSFFTDACDSSMVLCHPKLALIKNGCMYLHFRDNVKWDRHENEDLLCSDSTYEMYPYRYVWALNNGLLLQAQTQTCFSAIHVGNG